MITSSLAIAAFALAQNVAPAAGDVTDTQQQQGREIAAQQAAPQAPSSSSSSNDASAGDIIVTAQKRSQSINDVGLTITALSGDVLTRRGINDVYDLAKVVPGLSVANTGVGASVVYTLRGIGFNSINLNSSPTVSVYTNEIALPYPAMTQGVGFDLERVEVLKGPQGTLFGQSTTAGAINYIAAMPTERFSAGINGSYGRFDWWNVSGHVSGPITDTLHFRIAASQDGGGAWQKSYTRNDKRGKRDKTQARGILDWEASDSIRVKLMVNYWRDKSDSQALQFVRYAPLLPPGLPGPAAFPPAPHSPRAADWDVGKDFKLDVSFFQPSLRFDWDVADGITLTSTSAYSYYRTNSRFDGDGTSFEIQDQRQKGKIRDFNQEIRLSGDIGGLTWVVGGSYEKSKVDERLLQNFFHLSNVQNVGGSGFSLINSNIFSNTRTEAKAVFANADYKINDQLSVVVGGRYTDTRIKFRGCALDAGTTLPNTPVPGVTADVRQAFNIIYGALTGNVGLNPVQPGGCITLDNISRNGNPPTFLPTESPDTLSEDNFSWNLTANYKPIRSVLLYARVAQGYKSGSYPTTAASASAQFRPAKQEGLLAYEAGFKLSLLDRTLQLDGAIFYYDYKNKQLSNFIADAVFGPLVAIVNVPKSNVKGAEGSVTWKPARGLTLGAGATYIDSKITSFTGFDQNGVVTNFSGAQFNLAPKWTATADLDYRFAVSQSLTASVGGGLSYHSKTTGIIGTKDSDYDIDPYTLIDLQAGVESNSGWSAKIWGKNVTNKYYWTNANHVVDNIIRTAGFGATYGITLGMKY